MTRRQKAILCRVLLALGCVAVALATSHALELMLEVQLSHHRRGVFGSFAFAGFFGGRPLVALFLTGGLAVVTMIIGLVARPGLNAVAVAAVTVLLLWGIVMQYRVAPDTRAPAVGRYHLTWGEDGECACMERRSAAQDDGVCAWPVASRRFNTSCWVAVACQVFFLVLAMVGSRRLNNLAGRVAAHSWLLLWGLGGLGLVLLGLYCLRVVSPDSLPTLLEGWIVRSKPWVAESGRTLALLCLGLLCIRERIDTIARGYRNLALVALLIAMLAAGLVAAADELGPALGVLVAISLMAYALTRHWTLSAAMIGGGLTGALLLGGIGAPGWVPSGRVQGVIESLAHRPRLLIDPFEGSSSQLAQLTWSVTDGCLDDDQQLRRWRAATLGGRTAAGDRPASPPELSPGGRARFLLGCRGVGLGRSSPWHIQHVDDDALVALMAQEMGLPALFAVLLLYLLLAGAMWAAARSGGGQALLQVLAAGTALGLLCQLCFHLGGSVSGFLFSGVTAPFLSYGPFSGLLTGAMVGAGFFFSAIGEEERSSESSVRSAWPVYVLGGALTLFVLVGLMRLPGWQHHVHFTSTIDGQRHLDPRLQRRYQRSLRPDILDRHGEHLTRTRWSSRRQQQLRGYPMGEALDFPLGRQFAGQDTVVGPMERTAEACLTAPTRGERPAVSSLSGALQRRVVARLDAWFATSGAAPARAAVLVMSTETGEIWSWVNYPVPDTAAHRSLGQWNHGRGTGGRRLAYDWTVHSSLVCGSVLKPISAVALAGSLPADFRCGCRIQQQRIRWRAADQCSSWAARGQVSLVEGIARSCNLYFSTLPVLHLRQWLQGMRALGFQIRTGDGKWSSLENPLLRAAAEIPLAQSGEQTCTLEVAPSRLRLPAGMSARSFSPDRCANKPEHCSDVMNLGIGQGRVTVSLPHVALLYALIAGKGRACRPALLKGSDPGQCTSGELDATRMHHTLRPRAFETVYSGLAKTVTEGTAKALNNRLVQTSQGQYRFLARPLPVRGGKDKSTAVKVAGKTGSAERDTDRGRVVDSWFVALGPYPAARFVVLVHMAEQGQGAAAAGSMALSVLADTLNLEASHALNRLR